ncbi:MAG: thiamine phosphate synthase [Proteocatella sp.]
MNIDLTLYLVTDRSDMDESVFLSKIELACKGGITLLQLREKDASSLDFLDMALKVKSIADRYSVPLLIDDRIDIALACNADGVHLGKNDLPVAVARKILGNNKIIGATAKTITQALAAAEAGADYLGVGAIFPTTTKVVTLITDVRTLNDICNSVAIPVVAIGGLNIDNCHVLSGTAVNGIAVVSAIMKAHDPQKASCALKEKISSILEM